MPRAAEWIILESLLWWQFLVFECQVKVPAVTSPGVAQVPAQVSLNKFCFIIFQPWWSRTLTITDPQVLITNLSALGLSFFLSFTFKVLFYAFILL